jgi:hypothetical protein
VPVVTHSTDRTSATTPRAVPRARGVDPAVVAWVVASCERQGVPVKVTDAAVLARIGVLLGAPDTAVRPSVPRRRPDDADTVTSLSA